MIRARTSAYPGACAEPGACVEHAPRGGLSRRAPSLPRVRVGGNVGVARRHLESPFPPHPYPLSLSYSIHDTLALGHALVVFQMESVL